MHARLLVSLCDLVSIDHRHGRRGLATEGGPYAGDAHADGSFILPEEL